MKRIYIIPVILLLIAVCLSCARAPERETARKVQTMVVTFQGLNSYEGSMALIFVDQRGNRVWFSRFHTDISRLNFYFTEHQGGNTLPRYILNRSKVGKKYIIRCVRKMVEGKYSGESRMENVVISIIPLR
jgi:hypothetical protein